MGLQILDALRRAGLVLVGGKETRKHPQAPAKRDDGVVEAAREQNWPPDGVSRSRGSSVPAVTTPAAATVTGRVGKQGPMVGGTVTVNTRQTTMRPLVSGASELARLIDKPAQVQKVMVTRTVAVAEVSPLRNLKPVGKPVSPQVMQVQGRLVRDGDFRPHALFDVDGADDGIKVDLTIEGINHQMSDDPDNESDMTMGLDFGTSSTKVVIRDRLADPGVFPVKLVGNAGGNDGCLLPSRVYKSGDVYSLTAGGKAITDLKLGLLACKSPRPVNEFNDCCAFLALVIRQARGWLFTEHRSIYARHKLNWRVNLGLAARSYHDEAKVDLFKRLAWAAANLAGDSNASEITLNVVDEYRRKAWEVVGGGHEFESAESLVDVDQVDVVPEVSAQLHGFMMSANWDWSNRPIMMLVDIGAGTVDAALFHVRKPPSGSGVLTFYSTRVGTNGVMNLHRERVDWLKGMLPDDADSGTAREYLARITSGTDRLRAIPARVDDYLPGYRLEMDGDGVDQKFWGERYRAQVVGSIQDAKTIKGIRSGQLERVPLLLCGGGSRMKFFAHIDEAINRTQGWTLSVEKTMLPVPRELADIGWHAEQYDRISVAYGLSFSGDGDASLGRIVRAIDVPDVPPRTTTEREDRYVSKDQM